MPLSRAEVQRRYRERKKNREGEAYLAKERQRQHRYYKPVVQLSFSEKKKRNEEIRKRVQKHRMTKRLDRQQVIDRDHHDNSSSGYYSQESTSSHLVVRLPLRRNGPKKRLSRALETAKAKLRRVINENLETKKKVRTLQRRLQRLTSTKQKIGNLTPRRKTAMFMKSAGVKGEKVKQQLLFGNVLCEQLRINARQKVKKHERGFYSQITGDMLRKYRCIGKLAAELQMNRNRLANVIKNGVNMSKLRRMRTQMKLRHSVTSFLEREDTCRIQPGKRDATKSNGQHIQTRILTDYMTNLHQKYLPESRA